MCGDTASGILMGLTLSKIISRLLIGCIKQQPQSPQSLLICWHNFMHRALAWIATQSRPCIFMKWPPQGDIKGLFDHRSVILAAIYASRATAK
jgi:hypothetical protein